MNKELTNIVLSLSSLGNKRIESLSNKVLKKMSFKSSKDLENMRNLCFWLYIYGYTEQFRRLYPTIFALPFTGNWDIWVPIESILSLAYYVSITDIAAQTDANLALEKVLQAQNDNANIIRRCNGCLLSEYEEKVQQYSKSNNKSSLRNWLCYEMEELVLIYTLGGSEKYPLEKIETRVEEIKETLKGM